MRLITAVLGLCTLTSASAGEYPLPIQTDLKVEYFVIEKAGTPEQPTLLLKRVRSGATSYSKRLFDCKGHAYKFLGSGESLKAVAVSKADEELVPVQEGTIAEQLWKHACGE